MNKERLDEIKETREYLKSGNDTKCLVAANAMDELINEVERLQKELAQCHIMNHQFSIEHWTLVSQNKRYSEALESIIHSFRPLDIDDAVQIATEALKEDAQ